MTKAEDIKNALQYIGWSWRYRGCDTFEVMNPDGKSGDWLFDGEAIWIETAESFAEQWPKDKYIAIGKVKFMLNKCYIDLLDDCFAINCRGAFITFRRKNSETK